jgi:hypothetical protein
VYDISSSCDINNQRGIQQRAGGVSEAYTNKEIIANFSNPLTKGWIKYYYDIGYA